MWGYCLFLHPKITTVNCRVLGPRRLGMSPKTAGIKLIDDRQSFPQTVWGISKVVKISTDRGYSWAGMVPMLFPTGMWPEKGRRSVDFVNPKQIIPSLWHYDSPLPRPPPKEPHRFTGSPFLFFLFLSNIIILCIYYPSIHPYWQH